MQWRRVKWTEARQVSAILGWPEEEAAAALTSPPREYFLALRSAGRDADAAAFLGQALPRLEAVAWGARSVRDLRENVRKDSAEAAALKAALLWVQDPSESRRRACFDAAMAADGASAEALAAMAAFYSGGSVAPPDNPPVPAPKDAAGRFASGAVLVAAAGAPDMAAALARCLDAGEAMASAGITAGAAA
jgi:hypothetical protein